MTTFVSVVKAQKYKLNYKLIYSPDTTDVKKTKNELFTLFIVDFAYDLDLLDELTKAGTEYNANFRRFESLIF